MEYFKKTILMRKYLRYIIDGKKLKFTNNNNLKFYVVRYLKILYKRQIFELYLVLILFNMHM